MRGESMRRRLALPTHPGRSRADLGWAGLGWAGLDGYRRSDLGSGGLPAGFCRPYVFVPSKARPGTTL